MFGIKLNRTKIKQELDCSAQEISLVDMTEGKKAIMTHNSGGIGAMRRLAEMGLTPGCEVKLLRKCSFHGPLEIEVRGVALALGYGLAQKVFVQPMKANANET
jgi:ferrous iron transport protein A